MPAPAHTLQPIPRTKSAEPHAYVLLRTPAATPLIAGSGFCGPVCSKSTAAWPCRAASRRLPPEGLTNSPAGRIDTHILRRANYSGRSGSHSGGDSFGHSAGPLWKGSFLMRRLRGVVPLFVGCLLLFPALAQAQATLAGVVRDNTGAVLPGVTVEATSPVLIEKARTAVTDGSGQYRITDLEPGLYSVSFTLSGFNVTKRDNLEVRGSGVIPINAEMRIGALQETITVTGESPLVDTQTTRRETVLTSETLQTLPATRTYGALLNAIPGLSTNTGSLGAMATPDMTFFTANGGRQNGGQVQIDGMPVAASFNGGGVSTFTYDVANAAEMQV